MTPEGIPSDDRGLNYGDGLFETMRAECGRLPLQSRHLARLEAGCRRIGLAWPGRESLVAELASAARLQRGVVKLVLTRGSGGRGYTPAQGSRARVIVSTHPLPACPRAHYRAGISVRLCRVRVAHSPDTAGLKHLGRLEQVLASMEPDEGAAEGLMRDPDDRVVEGIRSNLFLVRDGVVVTPDLSRGGVAGVMRAAVLETAARCGVATRVADVLLEDLIAADEAFLSNSVFGLWPVRTLLHQREYGPPGPVTRRLMMAVAELGVAEWAP